MSGIVEAPAPQAAERPSARADLITAAVWIAFGAAVVVGAWSMDRLHNQGATLYSYPGLVPGLLGAAVGLMGVILGARAVAQGAFLPGAPFWPGWNPRLTASAAFMLVYALGLVARMPFWLATWLFVSGFVAAFEWRERGARGARLRGMALAMVYGGGTALIVTLAFERLFLVRLP